MSTGYSSPMQLTEDLLKTYKQMEKTDKTVPFKVGGGKFSANQGGKRKK